jgi:hypothetical protein
VKLRVAPPPSLRVPLPETSVRVSAVGEASPPVTCTLLAEGERERTSLTAASPHALTANVSVGRWLRASVNDDWPHAAIGRTVRIVRACLNMLRSFGRLAEV